MFAGVKRALSNLTSSEKSRYFLLLGIRICTGLLDAAGIALIAVIAALAGAQLSSTSAAGSGTTEIFGFTMPELTTQQIGLAVALVLAVFVGKSVLAAVLIRAQSQLIARIETRNATAMVAHIFGAGLGRLQAHPKADLQYATSAGATFGFAGVLNNTATVVAEAFLLLVIALAFLFVNFGVAIFALAYFALVIGGVQFFIGRAMKRAGNLAATGTVASMHAVGDTVDAFREVAVLGRTESFVARFHAARQTMARGNASMYFWGGLPRYLVESALIVGVALLVGHQIMFADPVQAMVTVGVFLTGGVRMVGSLVPLQNALANLRTNIEQAAPSYQLLDEVSEAGLSSADSDGRAEVASPAMSSEAVSAAVGEQPVGVEVSRVTFTHPHADAPTLTDINFALAPGQLVAVVGPSGAGKTTLVDVLLGLLTPDQGTVSFAPAGARVAYVPQRPGIVAGTIKENILLGLDPHEVDEDRLAAAVTAAQLAGVVAAREGGLEASLDSGGAALSGGQIQRIGLARALYHQPQFLVLDEATSGLDAGTEALITQTLAELRGKITMIVIAHRLATVQHADHVLVMDEGRILAQGTFKEVSLAVPMISEFVKLQTLDVSES